MIASNPSTFGAGTGAEDSRTSQNRDTSERPARKRPPKQIPNSRSGKKPAPAAAPAPRREPEPDSTPVATDATGAFEALGLRPDLCSGVYGAGYTDPTPIQTKAIPHILEGKDLLGCARTGTGKTAAFALPILQQMLTNESKGKGKKRGQPARPYIRTLVLAPTRELAAQISDSFKRYASHTKLRTLVIFGGVGKQPQIQALKNGVDILVATPGRLLDLHESGVVDLRRVEHYVLDEADRMLDMGFIKDVRRITAKVPDERQTLLFSATMPKAIQELSKQLLYQPVKVAVDPVSSTAKPVSQSLYAAEKAQKTGLLAHILQDPAMTAVLVFTRTKHGADRVVRKLARAGIDAAAIHGNKSQGARERALQGIKDGTIRVLIATDIAARGIDVKDLSHVINYDLPNVPEDYVHRIGRTGRAGAEGVAISFCAKDERPFLADIEKLTKQQLIRLEFPKFTDPTEGQSIPTTRRPGPPGSRRPVAQRSGRKPGGSRRGRSGRGR